MSNIETILGRMVGGPGSRCLGILGAGQIDVRGNVNSTKIPGVTYLVGSGGANDVAATSRESIVVTSAGKDRLLPQVPYVTFPGDNVSTLITDVGVFEKTDGKPTFTLTHYLPASDHAGESDCLAAIRKKVGWDLDVAPDLKRLGLPSQDELTRLRLFDPRRFFISD
ncbi:hypothetical protein [Desulfosarcina variabilis]|uniref:hypothetical protein n=1 Tax=Desulfosarcina variabilis TaxID=2300 RepID=UPI003AFA5145